VEILQGLLAQQRLLQYLLNPKPWKKGEGSGSRVLPGENGGLRVLGCSLGKRRGPRVLGFSLEKSGGLRVLGLTIEKRDSGFSIEKWRAQGFIGLR
jgi:hypothetical protein